MLRKLMGSHARALLLGSALVVSAAGIGGVIAQEATPEPAPPVAQSQNANRGYLGISIVDADGSGARVVDIVRGAPAADTELEVGDVITAVNGTEVANGSELSDAIAALSVGDTVTLDVVRDDETFTVEITLGDYPEAFRERDGRSGRQDGGRWGRIVPGVEFSLNMNGTAFSYRDGEWTLQSLPDDSPLAEAGLQEGDVITAINGESIAPGDLLSALGDDDETVELTVKRDDETVTVTIDTDVLKELITPMGRGFRFTLPGRDGFAIPDREGRFQIPRLQPFTMSAFGNGWLGLTFVTLDETVAEERGVEQTEGALVVEVVEESPAAEAGLQANDVIIAVNGEPVDAERTLRDRLIAYEPEDVVTLTVLRDGEELSVEVTLGQPQIMEMIPFFDGDFFEGMLPDLPFEFVPPIEVTPPVRPNV